MVESMLSGKPQHAKTASAGMPVPGTNTIEHDVHEMYDMSNMDVNHM